MAAVMTKMQNRPMGALIAVALVLIIASGLSAQTPEPPAAQSPAATPGQTRIEELERRIRELESRLLDLEGVGVKQVVPTAVHAEPAPHEQKPPATAAQTPSEES